MFAKTRTTAFKLLTVSIIGLSVALGGCATTVAHDGHYRQPTHGWYDYYYYPTVDVYLELTSGHYWYHDHDHWKRVKRLPPYYRLHDHDRVRLRLDTDRPHRYHQQHRDRYKGHRTPHGGDYRDRRDHRADTPIHRPRLAPRSHDAMKPVRPGRTSRDGYRYRQQRALDDQHRPTAARSPRASGLDSIEPRGRVAPTRQRARNSTVVGDEQGRPLQRRIALPRTEPRDRRFSEDQDRPPRARQPLKSRVREPAASAHAQGRDRVTPVQRHAVRGRGDPGPASDRADRRGRDARENGARGNADPVTRQSRTADRGQRVERGRRKAAAQRREEQRGDAAPTVRGERGRSEEMRWGRRGHRIAGPSNEAR